MRRRLPHGPLVRTATGTPLFPNVTGSQELHCYWSYTSPRTHRPVAWLVPSPCLRFPHGTQAVRSLPLPAEKEAPASHQTITVTFLPKLACVSACQPLLPRPTVSHRQPIATPDQRLWPLLLKLLRLARCLPHPPPHDRLLRREAVRVIGAKPAPSVKETRPKLPPQVLSPAWRATRTLTWSLKGWLRQRPL